MALMCFFSVMIMIISMNINHTARNILLVLFAVLLLVSAILLILCRKKLVAIKRLLAFILFLIITLILLGSANVFADKNDQINSFRESSVEVTGTVTDSRFKSSGESSFEVNILSLNGEAADLDLVMTLFFHSSLKEGDSFYAQGSFEPLSITDEAYVIADGFNGKLICENADDIKIKGVQTGYYVPFFKRINSYFQDILFDNTDEETGRLLGALLLGNRDLLDNRIQRDFGRCGISHMLALSGLHMSIIIGFFDLLMRKVLINRRYRCVILIFLAISYLAITGFSPSASRAVIMLCIVYISYLANNDTDSITSLFIALTLILAFSPYAAYDVALWMSFFATLGILIVSEILSVLKYRLKKKPIHIQILVNITVSIAITLAAIFFTCVFTWLFFGEISLVSPVTNLIFSPLMTLSLILGLLLILLSPVSFLAKFIGQAIILLADIFTESAAAISRLRGITVSLKYEFVPFIIIPLIITLIVFLLIKLKRKWIIAIPPLLSVLAFAVALGIYNSENKSVFDVIYMKNKRSEMLIVTTLDETSICDISTGGYRNLYSACYESSMLEYSTEIESIILTHYHNYHPSSLSKICSDFMVRYVYLPLPEKFEEWEIQAEMVDALKDTGVTVKVYKRGNNIEDSSGNTISVSTCEYSERSTHPLFSVSVSSETKTFTYATSALLESEAPAIENKTDILLLGTHGATVRSFDRSGFLDEHFEEIPSTIVFSSPYEMLEERKALDYVHSLYQSGHTVIIDGKEYYKFDMN